MRLSDIKIGNHVILVDGAGIFTIEMHRSYEIAEVEKSKDEFFIRVADCEEFYNSKRFKVDVKYQRKEKIKKIENAKRR